jgi:hypothetical protein
MSKRERDRDRVKEVAVSGHPEQVFLPTGLNIFYVLEAYLMHFDIAVDF